MSASYSPVYAKVLWADRQTKRLNEELAPLVATFAEKPMVKPDPAMPGMFQILPDEDEPLPDLLLVDVGRIIGAVRSALDNLVAITVQAIDPSKLTRQTSFPISRRAEDPGDTAWMGARIAGLPKSCTAILQNLHPYATGNDLLQAMNELRVQDEHYQINVSMARRSAHIEFAPIMRNIVADPDAPKHFVVVGGQAQSYTGVTFRFGSGTIAAGWPIIPTLMNLIHLAHETTANFDAAMNPTI